MSAELQLTNIELSQSSEKHGALSFDVHYGDDTVQINVVVEGTIKRSVVIKYSEMDDSVVMYIRKQGSREAEIFVDLLEDKLNALSLLSKTGEKS